MISKTGYTMIEILIVICIIGVALIPIFGLFIKGTSGTVEVTNTAIACNLAAESLDILGSLPFVELKNNFESYQAPPIEVFGSKFEKEVSITEVVSGELIKVDVLVKWQDKGKDKKVIISTLVGNQGI